MVKPNDILRFFLELAALAAFALWGAQYNIACAIVWFVVPAALWGVFRMRDDGGPPVVEVSGRVRLVLEAAVFGGATYALVAAGRPTWAIGFAGITVVHYAFGHARLRRMIG